MSLSTDNNTTLTKVVLSCFGLLVGLWQIEYKAQISGDTKYLEYGSGDR